MIERVASGEGTREKKCVKVSGSGRSKYRRRFPRRPPPLLLTRVHVIVRGHSTLSFECALLLTSRRVRQPLRDSRTVTHRSSSQRTLARWRRLPPSPNWLRFNCSIRSGANMIHVLLYRLTRMNVDIYCIEEVRKSLVIIYDNCKS